MKRKQKFYIGWGLLAAFVLWTVLVQVIDVQAIGPNGSVVGFASMNGVVHECFGVHMMLYLVTDWLSLIPLGFILGFALMGMVQWIQRKHIRKVDRSILLLGGLCVGVLAVFLFFELCEVNYRPVLINGVLEASYPSSTTMLVMCVIPVVMMQLCERMENSKRRQMILILLAAFAIFMVIARLISGVHWLSDIIGGALLSGGLVMLYYAVCESK